MTKKYLNRWTFLTGFLMAAVLAGRSIDVKPRRREDPLPGKPSRYAGCSAARESPRAPAP